MVGPRAFGPLILASAALAVATGGPATETPPGPIVTVVAGPPEVPRRLADCDAAVRAAPADYASYDCYRRLAHARQEWDGAVDRLEALLARDAGNTLARVVLGRIESDRDRPRAEELLRVSADEFARAAMPVGEVFARLDLAFLLRRLGRLDAAAAEVERARRSATAANAPLLVATARAEEAWIAYARADYARSHELFRHVEQDVFPAGPWATQASVLSGIGSTLWAMGLHAESLATYRRLAEARRARGDLYEEAGDLFNVSLLAGKLVPEGMVSQDELGRLQREALDAALRVGNERIEARVRMSIAETPGLDPGERRDQVQRALAIAEKAGDEETALFALRELSRIVAWEDPARAAEAYRLADEAVWRGRATGDPPILARGLIRRAQIRWIMGPPEKGIEEGLEALDAIERIRDLQRDDLVRARLAGEWSFYYYMLSGAVLSRGEEPGPEDLELAFAIMERLRGRVLLDALDAARATPAIVDRGPVHAGREEVLGAIERERQRLQAARPASAERAEVMARLEQLEAQESALRETLLDSDPAFAALRRPALPTLDDLQHALREDEALLAYQIADRVSSGSSRGYGGGSHVFVVTRAGTHVHALPEESELTSRVSTYLGFLGRRDGSDGAGSASLHRALLADALRDLGPGVTRLVIVPDKRLFRLPFDALRAGEDEPPLAAGYEVSVVPSAALWLRWRRAGAPAAAVPALVAADPSRRDAALRSESFRGEREPASAEPRETSARVPAGSSDPSAQGASARGPDAPDASAEARESSGADPTPPEDESVPETAPEGGDVPTPELRAQLGPLPYARREARAIVRALGAGSTVVVGAEASEAYLDREDLRRFGLLHFAAHAVIDDVHPERSALVLAPGDDARDGLLHVREIVGLDLPGSVVVLSACRSTGGPLLSGEGTMSLARGFFQAGARGGGESLAAAGRRGRGSGVVVLSPPGPRGLGGRGARAGAARPDGRRTAHGVVGRLGRHGRRQHGSLPGRAARCLALDVAPRGGRAPAAGARRPRLAACAAPHRVSPVLFPPR